MTGIFVDANILLDYCLEREEGTQYAHTIFTAAYSGQLKVYTSSSCILTTIYFMQKLKIPVADISYTITGLLQFVFIVDANNKDFMTGLNAGFTDLEDGVQYYTALNNKSIQLFITNNLKDYKKALPQLKVLSPNQFIKEYGYR